MDRGYETVCILKPEAGEAGVKDVIEKAKAALAAKGGAVGDVKEMGRKRLAYPIEKKNEGYYIVFTYSGGPAVLKEIDKYLRFNEDVIRYQTVRLEAVEKAVAGAAEEKAGAAEPAAEKAEPAAEKAAGPVEKTEPAAEKAPPAAEEKAEAPAGKAEEDKGGEDA